MDRSFKCQFKSDDRSHDDEDGDDDDDDDDGGIKFDTISWKKEVFLCLLVHNQPLPSSFGGFGQIFLKCYPIQIALGKLPRGKTAVLLDFVQMRGGRAQPTFFGIFCQRKEPFFPESLEF